MAKLLFFYDLNFVPRQTRTRETWYSTRTFRNSFYWHTLIYSMSERKEKHGDRKHITNTARAQNLMTEWLNTSSRLSIFWNVTPCRLEVDYRRFGATYRMTVEDSTERLSRNVNNRPPTYAAQHPRRAKAWTLSTALHSECIKSDCRSENGCPDWRLLQLPNKRGHSYRQTAHGDFLLHLTHWSSYQRTRTLERVGRTQRTDRKYSSR